VCHNEYDKAMVVKIGADSHVFDCFECAIHALAPPCSRCGCRVIGHGAEKDGRMFCGARCAVEEGVHGLEDRA
jgi:hypothetical protein